MRFKNRRRRKKGCLNYKNLKGGIYVYNEGDYFFTCDLRDGKYKLLEPDGELISYIPDCGDEEGDDDFNCEVYGYQKWLVLDLKSLLEKKVVIHFFIAKWDTILNSPYLYGKICHDLDESEFLKIE